MNKMTIMIMTAAALSICSPSVFPQRATANVGQQQVHLNATTDMNSELDNLLNPSVTPNTLSDDSPGHTVLKLRIEHDGTSRVEDFKNAVHADAAVP